MAVNIWCVSLTLAASLLLFPQFYISAIAWTFVPGLDFCGSDTFARVSNFARSDTVLLFRPLFLLLVLLQSMLLSISKLYQ
jgi:hypothetical protein